MITDEGIISVSVQFSSENPEAKGEVIFASCTQNISEENKNDKCCPTPLICQDLSIETNNIRNNQKYLLWHSGFPVESKMKFDLSDGESATIIIERYGKSTITETIRASAVKTLIADQIKDVFVKVNSESSPVSVLMEVCMREQLPLKGDENLCRCKY
ncbi:hypothetical protein [Defluviitalea saccharophila]|uniref:Uncharacterized protein n=1 Tax=Defluviitalea saccharophila TaxID=879970 RepID=A0ABZ2Y3B7_9FIRM